MRRFALSLILAGCTSVGGYKGAAEDYKAAQDAVVERETAATTALVGILHEIRDRPLVTPPELEERETAIRATIEIKAAHAETSHRKSEDDIAAVDGRLGALETLVARKIAEAEKERTALKFDRVERDAFRRHQADLERASRERLSEQVQTVAVPLTRIEGRLGTLEGVAVDQRAVVAELKARPLPRTRAQIEEMIARGLERQEKGWLDLLRDWFLQLVVVVGLLGLGLWKAKQRVDTKKPRPD